MLSLRLLLLVTLEDKDPHIYDNICNSNFEFLSQNNVLEGVFFDAKPPFWILKLLLSKFIERAVSNKDIYL